MPEVETKSFSPETLQDMLPIYYKRLFPHKQFYRWLSYNLCKFFVVSVFAPIFTFSFIFS